MPGRPDAQLHVGAGRVQLEPRRATCSLSRTRAFDSAGPVGTPVPGLTPSRAGRRQCAGSRRSPRRGTGTRSARRARSSSRSAPGPAGGRAARWPPPRRSPPRPAAPRSGRGGPGPPASPATGRDRTGPGWPGPPADWTPPPLLSLGRDSGPGLRGRHEHGKKAGQRSSCPRTSWVEHLTSYQGLRCFSGTAAPARRTVINLWPSRHQAPENRTPADMSPGS